MNTRRPINYGHKFFAKLQKKSRMAKYYFCFCVEIVMMSYQFLIAWFSHSKGLVKTMRKHSGDNSKSEHLFPIIVVKQIEQVRKTTVTARPDGIDGLGQVGVGHSHQQ